MDKDSEGAELVRAKRLRRRYLVFRVESKNGDKIWKRREIEEPLINSLLVLRGIVGLVETNFKLVKYDEQRSAGIISCFHKHVDLVRSAILMAGYRLDNTVMYTVKTTGTLKKAIKILESMPKIISHNFVDTRKE
ncbi:MAG: hypothetical protein DRJ49_02405 [Thermoprotei archaeon]|nr:MAG: hypothetical protein DRJ49_02405 [Thermoprotei archaeon]